jgi:hypothetical protein
MANGSNELVQLNQLVILFGQFIIFFLKEGCAALQKYRQTATDRCPYIQGILFPVDPGIEFQISHSGRKAKAGLIPVGDKRKIFRNSSKVNACSSPSK